MNSAAPAFDRSQPSFARIHLNTAGAGMPSLATHKAIRRHLWREARYGAMEAAAQVAATLRELRIATATLINADADEIAFANSGSAAFGCAFAALAPLRTNDRIPIGRHEWGGNVATYQRAAQRACAHVEVIPCRPDGSVDTEALAVMLDERVRLVP
jgi:cysteine desulfurase/selenocysteine lyase